MENSVHKIMVYHTIKGIVGWMKYSGNICNKEFFSFKSIRYLGFEEKEYSQVLYPFEFLTVSKIIPDIRGQKLNTSFGSGTA